MWGRAARRVWEVSSPSCVVKGDETGWLFSASSLRGHMWYLCACAYALTLKKEENFQDKMGKRVSQCKLTSNKHRL